jgi:hypothetical protein
VLYSVIPYTSYISIYIHLDIVHYGEIGGCVLPAACDGCVGIRVQTLTMPMYVYAF